MSNVFTLDSLRAETIRKYAPTTIELSDGSTVELKAILKLKKKTRDEVIDTITELNDLEDLEDDEDEELIAEYAGIVCETIAKVFRLIATSPRKLIAELEHEDPQIQANLYTAVLNRWIGESQVGEAVSSPA